MRRLAVFFRSNLLMFSHNLWSTLAARERSLERGHCASVRFVDKQESRRKKTKDADTVLSLAEKLCKCLTTGAGLVLLLWMRMRHELEHIMAEDQNAVLRSTR